MNWENVVVVEPRHRFLVRSVLDIRRAIHREKELKGRLRSKKVELIQAGNPTWEDLATDWYPQLKCNRGMTVLPNTTAGPSVATADLRMTSHKDSQA